MSIVIGRRRLRDCRRHDATAAPRVRRPLQVTLLLVLYVLSTLRTLLCSGLLRSLIGSYTLRSKKPLLCPRESLSCPQRACVHVSFNSRQLGTPSSQQFFERRTRLHGDI